MKNINIKNVIISAAVVTAVIFLVPLISRYSDIAKAKTISSSVESSEKLATPIEPIFEQATSTIVEPAPVQLVQPADQTQPIGTPVHLDIQKINVHATVKSLFGLTSDGKMAVPNNFTEVGWYNLGTKPGDIGSAVMGAHVDNGSTIPGVFKRLKELEVGDDIYTSDAAGNTLHFRIVQTKVYPYDLAITDEVFGSVGKARLNLITCYGNWLPAQHTYDQRLVVFAELVQ